MADGWGAPVGEDSTPTSPGWGKEVDEPGWGPPPGDKGTAEPAMPGVFTAIGQGLFRGTHDVGQTVRAIGGEKPEVPKEESPAAAPFEWRDLYEPSRGAAKFGYRFGHSYPSVAGGILGGMAGSAAGTAVAPGAGTVIGGLGGGAAGAGAGAILQSIGPVFADELKKNPDDPDGAWDRAVKHAEISGLFAGAGWAAFPLRAFQGPIKQLAFQAFGVQPGISVAGQAAQNVAAGKDPTENLGQAYVEGAVGTAVPAIGHQIIKYTTRPEVPPTPTPAQPSLPPPVASKKGWGPSAAQWWKENFQPELISEDALRSDPLFAKYRSASASEKDAIIHRAEENYYKWNKVPEAERLEFLKRYEEGIPQPDPWMQGRDNAYRSYLQRAFSDEASYGSRADYVENYLPHIWENPGLAKTTFENLALPQSLGPTWFQKARFYDLIDAGIRSGLKLKTTNPEELVTSRLLSGVDMRMRSQLLLDLNRQGMAIPTRMAPPTIANPSWRSQSLPWREVVAPNRESWMIAPDVQPLWKNAVESVGLWSKEGVVGNTFRGWMALKNAWVPIKLALSAFHPLHVAHINMSTNLTRAAHETLRPGQQSVLNRFSAFPQALVQSTADNFLALPIGTPFLGKRAREAWSTVPHQRTPEQQYMVGLMNEGGFSAQLSEQLRISAKRGFNDAINNNQYLKALPLGLRRGIEILQKPIFEHWIPNLKSASFLREAESLFRRRPELINDPINRRVALRAIGKQIDNRFGEMFYGGLFWDRTIKDASIASFLSLGWNLGFAREFVGGALEPTMRPFMKNATPTRELIRDVTTKTSNMLTYGISAMAVNALINKSFTGDNPEGYDYIFPRIGGNNPDGSPRRVTNMFYTREVPMAKKNIEARDSVAGGLAEMVYHKLMFQPFIEMGTNRDYFGYQIFDPNAPGLKQAWQFTKHLLGDQLNPMSIMGAKRQLELSGKPHTTWDVLKNLNDSDVYMSMLGFGPAPAYASKTPLQNKIGKLYQDQVAPHERPFEHKETMEKRREARTKLDLARQNKDAEKSKEALQELAKLGVKPSSAIKVQPGTQDIYMFSRLPDATQAALLKEMTDQEFKRYYQKATTKVKHDKTIVPYYRRAYKRED